MSQPSPIDSPPQPKHRSGGRVVIDLLPTLLPGLLLAILTTALCRAAAGNTLGLFIGGVAFASMLVPPLVSGEHSLRERLAVPVSVSVGVGIVWLGAIGDPLTFGQWLACSAALLAYAFALCGACSLLLTLRWNTRLNPASGGGRTQGSPLRGGATLAAAAVTIVALLWLTWPVWLSRALLGPSGDTIVAWLVPAHPLFAINGVLIPHFDTWDRHPLAYSRLTVLNQDVSYDLPAGVLWATLLHGAIAAATLALSAAIERRRTRRDAENAETAAF